MRRAAAIRRGSGLALAVLVVGGAALALFLRADKTDVFYAVRGDYAGARVRATRAAPASELRLVELVNDRGEVLTTAWLRRPRELAADHRVLLTYAGRKTGDDILELIPERADLVVAAVQYPYRPPEGLVDHLRWPYDVRRAVYRTVAGGMLAVSFLAEAEGLDPGRITLLGVSLGSIFATIHGALDDRVPRVLLVHGGGDLPAVVRWSYGRRGRWLRGAGLAAAARVLVASFEPLRYVDRIAPRQLLIIGARGDRYFPEESVLALYRRAGEPKALRWTGLEHVGARKEELVAEIVGEIEAYLDEGGALVAPAPELFLPGWPKSAPATEAAAPPPT